MQHLPTIVIEPSCATVLLIVLLRCFSTMKIFVMFNDMVTLWVFVLKVYDV